MSSTSRVRAASGRAGTAQFTVARSSGQLERVEVGGRRGCVTGIERLDLLPLLDILALLLLPGRREAVEQCVHFVYREDHRAAVGPGCAGGL